jgi:azurin
MSIVKKDGGASNNDKDFVPCDDTRVAGNEMQIHADDAICALTQPTSRAVAHIHLCTMQFYNLILMA